MSDAPSTGRQQPTLRSILARGHLRLVLFAVLLASVSLTVSGAFLIRGYAMSNAALTAQTISYAVEPAVLFGDRDAVARAISEVSDGGGIDAVEVVDASGRPIAEWRQQPASVAGIFDRLVGGLVRAGPHETAITYDGRQIGTVRVHGSADAVLRYAMVGLIIALCCLGITIIATRILARRLEEDVVAPIEHVGDVAHEVRTQREFARRVVPSGIAEIDRLGRDFNALLAELQGWHDSLESENVELARKAEHDALTGLGNRERFDRIFGEVLERSAQRASSFALLYIDGDNFKEINDTLGHDVGDMALCTIAERLRRSVREKDRVFRLGGDEFAILIEGVGKDAEIQPVVERIHRNFAEPFSTALREQRQLNVSVGTALYPADGETARQLLRTADRRMYRTKNKGSED